MRSKSTALKPTKPVAVRMRHNHKVVDRVVAENGKRIRLESGAVYPAHMVEPIK